MTQLESRQHPMNSLQMAPPDSEPTIAGKTHSEILAMERSKRCRWYKMILLEEKAIAMQIVNITMRAKMSAAKIEHWKDPEYRNKLSAAKIGENNPFLCVVCDRPLTGMQTALCSDRECHKELRKEYSRKWYQNNLERETKRRREYYWDNQEKKKEYRQNNLEKAKEFACKYYHNNLEKMREYGRRYYRRFRGLPEDWDLSRESSIEAIIKRWLQDSNIEFVQQHYINLKALGANHTHVDFFIEPNICLYSDGDYWHGLKDRQECDARINRALEEKGHIVIRLGESDILAGVRPVEILELIQ